MCHARQSGPDVERGKGGENTKAIMPSAGRKGYSAEDLDAAVRAYAAGAKISRVCKEYPDVPEQTIRHRASLLKNGVVLRKPGPPPILGEELEGDLRDWVVGMQKNGLPVNREAVLAKANDMYRAKYGVTWSTGFLTIRWASCFLKRHPDLSLRDSQVLKRARNEVSIDSLREFFIEYMKHVIERNASPDRVFNMDETGFSQKSRQTKVIVVKGSRNVWSKSAQCIFHLTIVACAPAAGFVCPPLYILPGERVTRDVLDECNVTGAAITTAPRGFIDSAGFIRWLRHFSNAVPIAVQRPLILVYDGCSSHYNGEIVREAVRLKIILVLLPANATHLLQPLNVAVFKPFKASIDAVMREYNLNGGEGSIARKTAIRLVSTAWTKGIMDKPANVIAGFRACGLWPVSLPQQQRRLKLFQDGGRVKDVELPSWLKVREVVQTEILVLPASSSKARKRRKTLDVNRRLFTREDLQNIDV